MWSDLTYLLPHTTLIAGALAAAALVASIVALVRYVRRRQEINATVEQCIASLPPPEPPIQIEVAVRAVLTLQVGHGKAQYTTVRTGIIELDALRYDLSDLLDDLSNSAILRVEDDRENVIDFETRTRSRR